MSCGIHPVKKEDNGDPHVSDFVTVACLVDRSGATGERIEYETAWWNWPKEEPAPVQQRLEIEPAKRMTLGERAEAGRS